MIRVLRSLLDWFTRGYDPETSPARAYAEDIAWLVPPSTTSEPAAWDQYWRDQVSHGLAPPLFDMFCDDTELVGLMARHGMTTVLCAGSGISQEPRALAEAGLRVVALDISPVALSLAEAWDPRPGASERVLNSSLRRPGGSLEYAVGSIMDRSLCTGPFDVIIERRTLQLFAPEERQAALEALASRLAEGGIFLSHCHDGGWRPPANPFHATEALFRNSGWTMFTKPSAGKPKSRSAWLVKWAAQQPDAADEAQGGTRMAS